jgi:adenylate cyclase
MHQTLKRYFGDVLSDKIIKDDGAIIGETKWVTICFTDISSYSTIVEYMSPAVAVEFLNQYFNSMHKIIEKHHGQILNYIGDSIMIVFGAPNNLKNHEVISVHCALDMRDELKNLNQVWDKSELSRYWKNHGINHIKARIGLHTGNVIAGNIGSEKMLQYSTIGDVVNVASRLEQANKNFKTEICMSQEIHTALTKELIDKSKFAGEIKLKGRDTSSKVFTI